jgi:hypothetical protein
MPEPNFIKLNIYVMTPDPILAAYFINPTHQSACLYVYPKSLLDNGSVRTFLLQRMHATVIEELLDASLYVQPILYETKVDD